jgi:DNA-binding beta-propeller fold protein YncE
MPHGDWATRVGAAVAATLLILLLGPAPAVAAGGALGFLEADVNGVGGVSGLHGADKAAVSPDGKNVYVAACAGADVAVFSRNANTGALSFVESDTGTGGGSGIPCAEDVAVSPDGANVYVAGIPDGFGTAVFSRDAATGALTFRGEATSGSFGTAIGVVVSPDGKNVYVSDYDNGVITYSRNSNGDLSFVESDGGIGGAYTLDISSDGNNVYVPAAAVDGTLTDFSRNATTGALNPDATYSNGGGVSGLSGAQSAAVSHDGANVYVAAVYDSTVATFSRSAGGTLGFVGTEPYTSAQDVVVSPDDANAYAVSFGDNSVASFSRNGTTGALASLGALRTGDPAIDRDNFAGAWGLGASPDGKNVYVAALNSDSVATFARNVPLAVTPTAKKRQHVGKLKAKAKCSLGCDLTAQAKVKVGTHKFKSKKVKETLFGDQETSFRLKFSAKMLRAIRKQLRHHKGTATITVNAASGSEQKGASARVKLRP